MIQSRACQWSTENPRYINRHRRSRALYHQVDIAKHLVSTGRIRDKDHKVSTQTNNQHKHRNTGNGKVTGNGSYL